MGNVLWLADPAQGIPFLQALENSWFLFEAFLPDGSANRAGSNRVSTDSMTAVADGKTLSQTNDPRFGRAVGLVAKVTEPVHRGYVENDTLSAFDHPWQYAS